ncbi:Glutamate 5-kinase [Gloeomargarita lithophora Alchichica-D10]|uniref:Glutamate 5-kinase n=1 Tax=Gloeomargarita lithophora Alchichica-D10 TaxID=1188229 RepID=A0A1J0ACJ9_9CYAN|nr:Glutamate 5-kinase [Gloeomargarita lithophora Alchichica-D10]
MHRLFLLRWLKIAVSQTIVVKIGTSSLTQGSTGTLALATLGNLVETLSSLRQQGQRLVLVSSGAVGVGCQRLGLTERPQNLATRQAVAAVGQGRLMRLYDDLFSVLGQPIAQVLLTREDLSERHRYMNILNTLTELLHLGIIPIVNENDTVAVEELRFGDNDTLSALLASLLGANWLILLTDVDRLYASDPRHDPQAQPIPLVNRVADLESLGVRVGTAGSGWGTGGMVTKITAARMATAAGVRTVITEGQQPQHLHKILAGELIGTHFLPHPQPVRARKRWLTHGLVPVGRLVVDAGAVRAIQTQGKSLLAAGIVAVEGEFPAQSAVQVVSGAGEEIARGLVNYNSDELRQIQGCRSEAIAERLGYGGPETVIHRDNLGVMEIT